MDLVRQALVDPRRTGHEDGVEDAAGAQALERMQNERPADDLELHGLVAAQQVLIAARFGQRRFVPAVAAGQQDQR